VSPIGLGGTLTNNVSNADFTVFFLSLNGRVVDQDNAGIGGVQLTVTGSHPASGTTATDGTFSIGGFLSTDSYTVTPTKSGYSFSRS
jgi:hypothetical protein